MYKQLCCYGLKRLSQGLKDFWSPRSNQMQHFALLLNALMQNCDHTAFFRGACAMVLFSVKRKCNEIWIYITIIWYHYFIIVPSQCVVKIKQPLISKRACAAPGRQKDVSGLPEVTSTSYKIRRVQAVLDVHQQHHCAIPRKKRPII